jgi:hypothetical protein
VQLAGRGDLRAVRLTVDHQATHAADALATVAVERDRLLAGLVQLLVQDIEHLQEAHVLADALELVAVHRALVGSGCLTPDVEGEVHRRAHL